MKFGTINSNDAKRLMLAPSQVGGFVCTESSSDLHPATGGGYYCLLTDSMVNGSKSFQKRDPLLIIEYVSYKIERNSERTWGMLTKTSDVSLLKKWLEIFKAAAIKVHVYSLGFKAKTDVAEGRWDSVMTDALYTACNATSREEMDWARKLASEYAASLN